MNVAPRQIVPLFTAMTGRLFTVTVETAAAWETHPIELVPETE